MKNNTFKRVLAGSLALLTVAAPMSANVEGILQEVAIVASAAQSKKLSVSWNVDMCDYIRSITFGGETISGTQVSKSTNYVFENVAGEVATIVTTVPVETWIGTAFTGYTQNTDKTTDQNYKFEKGQWRVSEKNGIFTYEISAKDDFCKDEALVLAPITGDTETVAVNCFDGTGSATTSILAWDGLTTSVADGKFYKYGTMKVESPENFTVKVFDGSKSNSVVNATVEYDTTNKKYVASFKMPSFTTAETKEIYKDATGADQTPTSLVIEIIKQKPEALTYTSTDNYLYANGNTVAQDSVAAQITAKQNRAEVKDEATQAIIDAEIKNTDLAYNGTFKYGKEVNDGVTVTVKRDTLLTVQNANPGDSNQAYAVFNVTKDGAVYRGWEDIFVENTADGRPADTTGDHVAFNSTTNEFTFPKFTEAGSYVITAKFFYSAANGGIDSKDINFKFTIDPIAVNAEDCAISFSYNGVPANANNNRVTPTPAYFNSDGTLEIMVPDDLKDTTFNAEVIVPNMQKTDEQVFNEWTRAIVDYRAFYPTRYLRFTPASGSAYSVESGDEITFSNGTLIAGAHTFAFPKDGTDEQKATFVAALPQVNRYKNGALDVLVTDNGSTLKALKYTIDGTLTATEFDTVNKVKVLVYDQNYGAPYSADGKSYKTINLKYTLVKAAQEPLLEDLKVQPDVSDEDGILKVAAADCKDLEAFKEIFWNNFKGNEIVEENKDKITFEYLEGMNHEATTDDLDKHIAGLPTEKSDINYTLYVCYEGETFAAVPLEVVSTKVKVVPADAELTKTFGDKVEFTDYTLTDANGKKVTKIKLKDIYVQVLGKAKDKNKNTEAIDPYKDADGKHYVLDPDFDWSEWGGWRINPTDEDLLDAGTYVVKFSSKLDNDADYTVSSDEYILTVEKRTITADMFTAPNQDYDGDQKTVNITNFTFRYTDANKNDLYVDDFDEDGNFVLRGDENAINSDLFKVSGGDTKGTGIGEYKIKISAQKDNTNFTGTAEVSWYVAYEEAEDTGIAFNWQDEDIWLYDNGRIHVTYEPTIVPKTGSITVDGKKVTVKDYGVVCDKEAKIAAPVFKDEVDSGAAFDAESYEKQKKGGTTTDLYDTAAETLTYGNGYIEGHASDDCWTRGDYGANIAVLDVNKGIWVRPYILLSNNTVVYGDPIYLDIVREAEKQLQFQLNPAQKLDKTNNLPGYDYETGKYVFYASYKKFDSKVQAKVKDFGVIVDKKNSFKTVNGEVVAVSDEKTTIEDAFKYGKGFVEGHFNPDNEVLGANEYGAKIKPQDSVSGVWVRGYIKLSDDLIIYTKPEYYNSVSDFYKGSQYATNSRYGFSDYMATTTDKAKANFNEGRAVTSNYYKNGVVTPGVQGDQGVISYTNTTGIYTIKFTNNVKANNSKLTFVAQGVVVDKNESLVNRVYQDPNKKDDNYYYEFKETANTRLMLGKGFKEGERTNAMNDYTATVAPVSGRAITVRPYTTFTVKGSDPAVTVTVYGDPIVAMGTETRTNWFPQV